MIVLRWDAAGNLPPDGPDQKRQESPADQQSQNIQRAGKVAFGAGQLEAFRILKRGMGLVLSRLWKLLARIYELQATYRMMDPPGRGLLDSGPADRSRSRAAEQREERGSLLSRMEA